jgi:hypothetical protein
VCGEIRPCERHHTIPVSLGGDVTIPLCVPCHDKVDRINMANWDQTDMTAGFQELFVKCGPAGRLYLLKALKIVAHALANVPIPYVPTHPGPGRHR